MASTGTTDSRFAVEQHGYDFIPEGDRYLSLRQLFVFWVGTNAYLFFFVVGTLGVILGLSLWQAVAAVVVGNALYALVAHGSIGGPRSGLPTMTFSRAPFGVFGNRANALLGWVVAVGFEVVNTLLGVFAVVALFGEIGWHHSSGPGKVVATVVVLGLSVVIAVVGHRLMMYVQRLFAVGLTLVLVVVFFDTIGSIHWSAGAKTSLSAGSAFGVFLVATAIVASGPISYLFNCADWPRYLPSRTSSSSIFWTVMAGSSIICVFLGILGAMLATKSDLTDPVGGVKTLVPEWLFVLYALTAAGGAIANNVPTFYASGLSIQAIGIPLRRWKATVLDSVLATALIIYVLFVSQNFTTYLNDFLSLLNVWMGPFGAIWIVDGVLRRWNYSAEDIHTTSPSGRYFYSHGVNVKAMLSLGVGMAVGALTINAPILQGYLSGVVWDGDLSWVAPWVVAGTMYYVLSAHEIRSAAGQQYEASADVLVGVSTPLGQPEA
jgi:nucleobase:cation symporter-1, NCS1 family